MSTISCAQIKSYISHCNEKNISSALALLHIFVYGSESLTRSGLIEHLQEECESDDEREAVSILLAGLSD